ncbi:MAG: DUF308 domain-containing protein [Faecalibacterium sp.]|nr:DUF308 domain-containing protein [Ruminococcus sp.]MCM1392205.1 DUF308 domain-containing protein [Ruminococcus sp.]MCM1485385.1 DUF308 domain-containing protein [Faecalibacterium sp.]
MKALKENFNKIILSLFELLVGILLLINPVGFTSGIITVAGIILIVLGIISIVRYFRTDAFEAAVRHDLLKGLIILLSGAFCVFGTDWFIMTFPALTIIYGIVTLFAGLAKIQLGINMLRLKQGKWHFALISAAISIICAVVILANPFTTTTILWRFTGASLIVEAVLDIVTIILGELNIKDDLMKS